MADEMADADRQPAEPEMVVGQVADKTADSDGQVEQGAWLSPTEAAAQLGVSQRTLDRRLAAGKLRRRTRPNGSTQVWVPSATEAPLADETADSDRHAAAERSLALVERVNLAVLQQVQPLLSTIERQQQQLVDQAERLGRLEAELAHAREQLGGRQTLGGISSGFEEKAAAPAPAAFSSASLEKAAPAAATRQQAELRPESERNTEPARALTNIGQVASRPWWDPRGWFV